MKIGIVGAGAIGGVLGVSLAQLPGVEVCVLARGATLDALKQHGWRLTSGGETRAAAVRADAQPAALGVQDVVIVAVKGQALPALASSLAPMIGPDTIVLPAMNGVPWWFCDDCEALQGQPLEFVDPGGKIAAAIPFQHVVGCVVHASASTSEPGVVNHKMGRGLIIGEPAGGTSARVDRLATVLRAAGFDVTVSANVRQDVWYKLWGNLTMNPVSAITGATIDRLLGDPLVRDFCSAAMREAARLGERIGCVIDQSPEDRHMVTAKLGAFKTSMLQDAEAGRPIELDAIVGAVHEIARRLSVPTPNIDALFGLARLFGQSRGLY
jgi:2-dehydropantoate 2-reductase